MSLPIGSLPARCAVVVVGSLHLDIMVRTPRQPRQGETVAGTAWDLKPGGKGGNQAVEAARHGAAVAMVGRVGADDFGRRLVQNLAAAAVDAQAVLTVPECGTGMSVALVDETGDYGAVIVSGASADLGPADLERAAPLLREARLLLLQNEIPEEVNLGAATLAKRSGVTVLLNAAPARSIPKALSDVLDILVVNAIEAEQLTSCPVVGLDAAAEAAVLLLEVTPAAIVTAGAAGVAIANRDGLRFVLPGHPVAVAGTHGAGDVFIGAFATRLAAGDRLRTAASYANAAAALTVGTPADLPRPTAASVAAFLTDRRDLEEKETP